MLPGISTEQLRSRLNRMVADGMLTRQRYREVPPRVDYELTERARELAPILGELARWGYNWAWSRPRAGESVDVGAVFRLIPGLVTGLAAPDGTVALTVTDGHHGAAITYRVTLTGGDATLAEHDSSPSDASISGPTQAWINALSPGGDRSGLDQSGDGTLAGALFEAFALAGEEAVELSAAESA